VLEHPVMSVTFDAAEHAGAGNLPFKENVEQDLDTQVVPMDAVRLVEIR